MMNKIYTFNELKAVFGITEENIYPIFEFEGVGLVPMENQNMYRVPGAKDWTDKKTSGVLYNNNGLAIICAEECCADYWDCYYACVIKDGAIVKVIPYNIFKDNGKVLASNERRNNNYVVFNETTKMIEMYSSVQSYNEQKGYGEPTVYLIETFDVSEFFKEPETPKKKGGDLNNLKVEQLKDLCKKARVKGYSKMKKAELIQALEEVRKLKEAKKAALKEAKEAARNELGKDFDKAVMFWKNTNYIQYMTEEDYHKMTSSWKLLAGLLSLVDKTTGVINVENLKEVAQAISDVFCPGTDFSKWTEDEIGNFIITNLAEFSLEVFSERLVKDTSKMKKITILDLDMGEEKFTFNDLRFYDPQQVDTIPANGIALLDNAEDGISRILEEKGVDTINVLMDMPVLTAEEEVLTNSKRRILEEGFYTVSGKHYMPAFQSPSANRKATITFVSVNGATIKECRKQVEALWFEVSGLKNWDDLKKALCDKEGKTVIAKVVARLSTRGSNSFSIDKIAPDLAEIIKNLKVKYVKDTETEVFKDYKTVTEAGVMELIKGKSMRITDGDGQGLIDYITSAYIAAALRRISRNELGYFLEQWDKIDRDVHNVRPGSRLDKIIKKIPAVFQIRHGEKKGLLVRWNLEAIKELGINIIIPDSVRKFIGGGWSEYPLEICNFLKKKGDYAYLNPQFISALSWENPNALIPVVQHWEKYQEEAFEDIAKAQQFHGIIKSTDDDENSTNASKIVSALRTSSDLVNDFYIVNERKKQFSKFNDDMKIGRVMVPGQYTYMVFDPAYLLNKWFKLDLPCLASGEYYHNGKDCKAMLARSPLIAPYEAQKVQLVNNEDYKYLADTIVFNGFDGKADDMGGGDHDGDQCLVVPEDTEIGKIVVDGVRDCNYVIWEEAKGAQKVELTWENILDYWGTDGSTRDKTGEITNYASNSLDIANHLRSCIHFAKLLGCSTVTFIHPKSFGKGLGCNYQPTSMIAKTGNKTFAVKGLAEVKFTNKAKEKYQFGFEPEEIEPWDVYLPYDHGDARGVIGEKTFEEVEEEIAYYEDINHRLRLLQGEEIDGAKTGYHPEIPDFVKITLTGRHMITRREVLSKEQSDASRLNIYWSLSPLARVHDYSEKVMDKMEELFTSKGSNKIFLLQSLLTKEEAEDLNKLYPMSDGSQMCLVDIVNSYKKVYNKKIYNIVQEIGGEDRRTSLSVLKSTEEQELYNLANILNISPKVVAVASYIATYTKDSKQGEGLSYAWILFDELLSVFSRGNKKFELFRLPASVETAYIKDKALYVNDNKHIDINAENCDNVVIQVINGRPYALIHKITKEIVTPRSNNVVYGSQTYTIGAYGFKYHIASNNPKDEWKKLVRENGFVFDITMDATNRAVISINGKSISALMNDASFDLMNKKVKVVNDMQTNPIKESDATIKNLAVIIIGEADTE